MSEIISTRRADAPVDSRFIERWSPRAFSSRRITTDEVSQLLEAMRWAPSCYNEQPWMVVHATPDEDLERMRPVLLKGNRRWADRAPFLAVIFARTSFSHDGRENAHAAFDCGAAWMSLALQARTMGLYAHAMAGFSRKRALRILGVSPDEFTPMVAVAVGELGSSDVLPEDLREQEAPNDRRSVISWARAGVWSKDEEP